jgi:chromosome segregation ATPase
MGKWLVRWMLVIVIACLAAYAAYFYRDRYQPLRAEADALHAKVNRLSAERSESEQALQRHNADLKQQVEALQTQATQIRGALQKAQTVCDTCETQRRRAEAHATDLEKTLNVQGQANRQLSQARTAAQQELAEVQSRHTQALQELQASVHEKDSLIQELQTRFAHLAKDSAEKQKDKESLEREVERLKTALDAARARAYMLEQTQVRKQQVLEAQQEEGVEDLSQKDRMIQDLMARVNTMERERSALAKARADDGRKAAEERAGLKQALELSQHRVHALEREAAGLQAESAGGTRQGTSAPGASRLPAQDRGGAVQAVREQPVAFPQLQQALFQQERRVQDLGATVAALQRDKTDLLQTKQRLSLEVLRWQAACSR